MSGSQAPFKPFQSGCSICKPSSDYSNYYQNAGGNYSKQGLIPRQSSSSRDLNYNGYSNGTLNKSTTNLMSNYGKSYQTTGGKRSKPKTKRSKRKKLSKSTLNKIKDLGKLLGLVDTGKRVVKKSVNTGKKVVKKSVNTGRKVVKKSVNTGRKVIKKSMNLGRKVVKRSMNLGRKVVKRSVNTGIKLLTPPKRKTSKRKTSKRKTSKRKITKRKVRKVSKKQRGGDTNWGATGMPARYYDPNVKPPSVNSSVYDTDTPYGKYSPTSLGKDCNLFPFNPYENPPTSSLLTGGRRKKKSKKKVTKRSVSKRKSSRGKKQRGGLCLQQGKDLLSSAGGFPYSPRWGKEHCGGRKKRSPKKKTSRN